MLRAIIFDFDGVIADSEPIHYRAFLRLAERWHYPFTWETYLERYVGYDDRDAIRALLQDARQPAPDDAQLRHLVQVKGDLLEEIVRQGVQSFPGTVEFIRQAAAELPIAIASGATRRDIDLILARLGLAELFEVIVTADMVQQSKPHPQTYLLALEQLQRKHPRNALTAASTLAIEDTPAGVEAARRAGLNVLALQTSTPAHLLHRAHRVTPNLQGLTLAQLRQWFGEASQGGTA